MIKRTRQGWTGWVLGVALSGVMGGMGLGDMNAAEGGWKLLESGEWERDGQKGAIRVEEGKEEKDVELKVVEGNQESEKGLRWALVGMDGVEMQVLYSEGEEVEGNRIGKIEITVKNGGKEQIWLEPRLEWSLPGGKFGWFDGQEEKKKTGEREELVGSLPLTAYHIKGESGAGQGWALGLDPRELVSHFVARLEESSEGQVLSYGSRMVVDPGQEEIRKFIIYSYVPDFGYLNAVALYHEQYPEVFKITEGVHPNLEGPISGPLWRTQNEIYPAAEKTNYFPQILEALRWTGGGWDWCYAGYGYRPGDWLCTEEWTGDWMVALDKEKPEEKVKLREFLKASAGEYLQKHLAGYDRLVAMHEAPMMYIIPSYCEEELAREHFADSIYYDEDGKTRSSGPPWVVRFDRSLQMYAYGNSFGDYTLDAIKKIVERSNIRGFGYDCIDRARYQYTGPGVERSPGRAYDKKLGVYVNMEIASAIFGQKVHELERDGYKMALTGNFRGSSGGYLSASVMDATLLEHSPWDERPMPGVVRMLMGQKTISYLHGYAKLPDVQKLEQERVLEMLETLQDFTILQGLRYAIYPNMHTVIGAPKMVYFSNIFNDLFREYQYQTVPAVRGGEKLWLSRYGKGAGGIIFAGNATPRKIEGDLEVVAKYFDAAAVAFVDYEGKQEVVNRVGEEGTKVPSALERGQLQLLAGALQWEKPFAGEVKGSRVRNSGQNVVDTLLIRGDEKSHRMFVTALPGYEVAKIQLNGEALEVEQKDGEVWFSAELVGDAELVVEHRPEVGNRAVEELKTWEFADAERTPKFKVVVAEDTPEIRYQVQRLGAFFSKLDHKAPFKSVEMLVGEAKDTEGLILYLGNREQLSDEIGEGYQSGFSAGEIFVKDGKMVLTGKDAEALDKTMTLFLDLLSERYADYGYLAISDDRLSIYITSFKPGMFQEKTGLDHLPWEEEK